MSDPLPRRANTPYKTIPPQTQRRLPVDPNRRFTITGCASAVGILAPLTPQQAEGRDGCTARVARWKVKPWPEWVGMSRTLALTQLGLWGIQLADDLWMALELVISELVTNTVKHGGPRQEHATVRLLAIDKLVMVEVIDTSYIHHLPELAAVDDDVEGGRGLALVEALAHQWGYYPTATGKSVWAIVGQPTAPAPLALPPAPARPTTRLLRADVYHRARPDPQIHAIQA